MLQAQDIQPVPWWIIFSLLVVAVLLSGFGADTSEPVSIETVLSWNVTSYQRHTVTVEGVARAVIHLPPVANIRCRVLYGRAAFMLEDEAGIVPVEVLGNCTPSAYNGLPQEGDRVRVTGIVEVMSTNLPRQVRIQATSIQVLPPSLNTLRAGLSARDDSIRRKTVTASRLTIHPWRHRSRISPQAFLGLSGPCLNYRKESIVRRVLPIPPAPALPD